MMFYWNRDWFSCQPGAVPTALLIYSTLFEFQLARRLLESIFIHKWSQEPLPNFSSLLGKCVLSMCVCERKFVCASLLISSPIVIGFYLVAPLSPVVEILSQQCSTVNGEQQQQRDPTLNFTNKTVIFCALVIFVSAR
jgi:hypothetical protein